MEKAQFLEKKLIALITLAAIVFSILKISLVGLRLSRN